jgi:hypothetical protein
MSAADDALDDAVAAVVNELRHRGDGQQDNGVVTAWACVVHTHSFDEDGHTQSAYYQLYSGGSVPDHVALGLYKMGEHLLLNGERVSGS